MFWYYGSCLAARGQHGQPARSATTSVDHGLSIGVRGAVLEKKKKRLLAESLYELVSLHGRVFVCNSNNFATSSFPLKQADVAQSQAKVSVGVLEFVLFIETALASLLVANS